MKKFTATFEAQNGFSHTIELQAKNKKEAINFAQAFKRRNGYLGKTKVYLLKNAIKNKLTNDINKEVINILRNWAISLSN